MTAAAINGTAALEKVLARLHELTVALDGISDIGAREAARELMGLLLDLHGLGLARMTAIVAADSALTAQLAKDPSVRALLLLHGLHPQDPRERLGEAIARMQPQWRAHGFHVDLVSAGPSSARVRLHNNGSTEPADQIRQEVEAVLVDAAPDLDDIAIELDAPTSHHAVVPV
jgi:hypothetical protein